MTFYYVWHETEEPNGEYEYFNNRNAAYNVYCGYYTETSTSFGTAEFIDNKLEPTGLIDFNNL